MGREIKRVALDFNWPLDKVWGGFVNPFYTQRTPCPACDGAGSSPLAKMFSDQWYGNAHFDPVEYGAAPLTVEHPSIQAFARRNVERAPDFYMPTFVRRPGMEEAAKERAIAGEAFRLFDMWRAQWCHHLIQADVDALIAAERLWDFTREPRTEEQRETQRRKIAEGGNSWLPESNGYTPTAEEVNAWSMLGFGHDAINQCVCVKARCEREGVTETRCSQCGGDGDMWPSPEVKRQYEEWTETAPPEGEGWQIWETVSEGSPVSPVLPDPDALINWIVANNQASREAAEQFVRGSGWVPSAMSVDGKFYAGIESAVLGQK